MTEYLLLHLYTAKNKNLLEEGKFNFHYLQNYLTFEISDIPQTTFFIRK